MICLYRLFCFCFFFKQKTAYEMRISDWSSDVCSSDLLQHGRGIVPGAVGRAVGLQPKRLFVSVVTGIPAVDRHVDTAAESQAIVDHDYLLVMRAGRRKIGRASCRERVRQYV